VGHAHKQEEESHGEGSPLWMVSFSDCMTLLMSFFLVLATFSASGEKGSGGKGGEGVGAGKPSLVDGKKAGNAAVSKAQYPNQPKQGSETATAAAVAGTGSSGGRANPKDPESYARKVFLIPSEELFYGKSDVITSDGKQALKLIGQYVATVKARMVISESGPSEQEGGSMGLPRAMSIMRFMVSECELSKDRMCVSVSGTAGGGTPGSQRKAEIALLERSVYK
jgi:flagellar motor protein MotB